MFFLTIVGAVLSLIKYNLESLDMFFKNEYAEILPELFNGEHSGGYINGFLPQKM